MLRKVIRRLGRMMAPVAVRTGIAGSPLKLLAPAEPLNLVFRDDLNRSPRLNVLIPGLAMHCMSGGPNTALNLTYRMAAQGVPVRYIATGVPPDQNTVPLGDHISRLSGISERLPHVEIVSGHDRSQPLAIGRNDVFLATAWWTAQMVKSALPEMNRQRFIYLIQDFEPGLHAYSTNYAMALETYDLDYYAIVNHSLLFDYLSSNRVGRFADADFASRTVVLDPAIDRSRFYRQPRQSGRARTLLFYARPQSALRNLFEMGVAALHIAASRGVFDGADWEILGIGDPFAPVTLGKRHEIRALPWMGYDEYAARMRSSHVLLSLMLSPHPSYPPLEMAATGGISVTNTFDCKTAQKLARLSPNILAARPTLEDLADSIAAAVDRCEDPQADSQNAALSAPASWEESMSTVLPFAMQAWRKCVAA